MNELDFNWKMKGLAKGVSPSIAADELRRLQNLHGTITPELLVKEAKRSKSPLHPIFEWDDTKAAYNYRLQQARVLLNNIQITVISDGEYRKIDVYEVTTNKEGYKSIDTFTPDDLEYVKNSCAQNLNYWKNKLRNYKEFDKVRELIEQAIEVINN
jgi:hypothetical protein